MHLAKVLVTTCTFFSIAAAETYTIAVGGSGLTFVPPSLSNVTTGDIVTFQFSSSSHSATESTFDAPCSTRSQGIDSGVLTSSSSPSTYSTTIQNGSSIWFYCKVGSHCKSGMVFAINPTAEQTYDAFKAKAMGVSVSGSSSKSPSASSTSHSPSASVSSPSTSGSGSGYGSSGVKASIQKMTAGLAGVALLVGLFA